MKAYECWHYLQVFNRICGLEAGYRQDNTSCYGNSQHYKIKLSQSRSVDPQYIYYMYMILILAILLCGRELSGRQDTAMHLSDQGHGICDTLIPAGRTPGRLTRLLTILQRFVT